METVTPRRSNNSNSRSSDTITRTRRQYSDYETEEEYYTNQESEKPTIKYRAGILVGIALVSLAFFFDLAEGISALFTAEAGSYVKDFASMIVFPFLFWLFKIPFWKGNKRVQKMVTMIIGFLVALVPFISDITPELTISVFMTILLSRVEDRMGMQGKMLQKNPNIVTQKRVRAKIRG